MCVWDIVSEKKLAMLIGHTDKVYAVALVEGTDRLISAALDGTVRIWDWKKGAELAQILFFNGGKDWLVTTPAGLFDGSARARQLATYRVGSGLNVVAVDRFFQDFYLPGLLVDIWAGKSPRPVLEIGQAMPPTIRIVEPRDGSPRDSESATIVVEVVDQGGGISGPWLRHNGARVTATADERRDGKRFVQAFDVQLVEGENRIRVEAASGDGSWESEPATLTLNLVTKLDKPDLHVLAIGVNKYADETMNLNFARTDADSIAKLFKQRGKSLYAQVHLHTLFDEQATKQNIRSALEEISEQAEPQDTLLVFLSGHGFSVGQRNHYISHEFKQESTRFENDVRDFGYPSDELADAIGEVPALKRMLILSRGAQTRPSMSA